MKKIILPILFICIAVLVVFGKTILPQKGTIIYGSDLGDQFYFWKSYFVDSIKSGVIPFWNPYSFSGTLFLAHPSIAPFYPFNLLFFLLPPHLAFSVFLYLHIVLAGLAMYWYAKKKADTISSLIAAVVFSLSGFFAVRIYAGHIDIISTIAWTPLVFGSIIAAIDNFTKRKLFIAVIFLCLQLLAGYQAAVFFTLEFIVLFLTFRMFFQMKNKQIFKSFMKELIKFATIVVSSYCLVAVQLLPTIEFVSRSIRAYGLSYEASTWGSYSLETLKLFLFPFAFGSPFWDKYSYHGPGPNYLELAYFVGVMPIILLLLYLIKQLVNIISKKKADRIFFSLLFSLAFFIALALGKNFPLHKILYELIPPYRLIRFPAQHLMMAVFILAAISGRVSSKIKAWWLRLFILMIIVLELVSYDKKFIKLIELPTTNFDTKLIKFLEENSYSSRVLPHYNVTAALRSLWDFESSSYYKIPITSGYNPLILYNYYHFIDLMNKASVPSLSTFNVEIPLPNLMSKLIDFLNIKYVLTGFKGNLEDYPSGKYKLIMGNNQYKLYENLTSNPRFFLVNNVQIYQSAKELERQILSSDPDLSRVILFNKSDVGNFSMPDLNCQEDSLGSVDVLNYTPNRIILKVNASCNSFLSTSEVFYPGWKARIDGQATDVYLSNVAFRSIYVPKGTHKIEFHYYPTIYYLGGLISLITFSLLFYFTRK